MSLLRLDRIGKEAQAREGIALGDEEGEDGYRVETGR
jgi:hypothetical protein